MPTMLRPLVIGAAFAAMVAAGVTALTLSGETKEAGFVEDACAKAAWPLVPAKCLDGGRGAEVRLINPLFTRPQPDTANFATDLNPNSLEVLRDCRLEPAIAAANDAAPVQFERQGYFVRDADSKPGSLVFNRTVGLRDSYAKAAGKG